MEPHASIVRANRSVHAVGTVCRRRLWVVLVSFHLCSFSDLVTDALVAGIICGRCVDVTDRDREVNYSMTLIAAHGFFGVPCVL